MTKNPKNTYPSFVVHDESVNTYGFRMLTSGVDLTEFGKNPVMFFNHDTYSTPIGRWENVRVEGTRILADPVFDEDDPEAAKIARKVARNFIRAASVGAWVSESSTAPELLLPGQTEPTVTKWSLREISICNIPSNHNAIALYDADGKPVDHKDYSTILQLTDATPAAPTGGKPNNNDITLTTNQLPKKQMTELQKMLALSDAAGESEILSAVRSLKDELAELKAYKTKRESEDKAKSRALFDELLQKHTLSGAITKEQKESYTRLFDADAGSTIRLLQSLPEATSVEQAIESARAKSALKTAGGKLLSDMTWTEIDREGRLSELHAKDPELYAAKFREQFGRDPKTDK